MSDITVNGIIDTAKPVAMQIGGYIAGNVAINFVSKLFTNETVKGFLGDDTTSTLKEYIAPVVVSGAALYASSKTQNRNYKNILNGAAVAGGIKVARKIFASNEKITELLGGEEVIEDDEVIVGFEGDEIESYASMPEQTIAALDIPRSSVPPLRDTEFEKEHISGFGSSYSTGIM